MQNRSIYGFSSVVGTMITTVTTRILAVIVIAILFAACSVTSFAIQSQQQALANSTPEDLQQLVAPIALYPDALVAQILAASTYPTQIVEADRWVQQHSNVRGEQLASEVDRESMSSAADFFLERVASGYRGRDCLQPESNAALIAAL